MKTLKRIGIGLVILIVLLAIIGFFLPKQVHVERSIVINAPAQVPFNLVNDLTQWKLWSPWHQIDPNTKWEFSGPASGTNSWYTWKSEHKNVGNGKLTIVESTPYTHIKSKLEFEGWDASFAEYIFTEENGSTKLTWTMDSDMGNNPMGRWFGLFMDGMIGKDYEKGLAKIKEISESSPAVDQVAGFDVEMRDMPAQKYIYIASKEVKPQEISIKIGESFMKLDEAVKQHKYTMTGPPFTIWTDMANFSSAFPVAEEVTAQGDIQAGNDEPFHAYVVKYYGAYDKNEHVYKAMDNFLQAKGAAPAGPPREVYITDPMMEKDTAKWLTEIVFPVTMN